MRRTSELALFALGASSLYFELLVVRWTNAYVRNVGFFTNFLVLASFVGLGVGLLLGERPRADAERPAGGTSMLVVLPLLVLGYCGLVHAARPSLTVLDAGALFWGDYTPSESAPAMAIDPETFIGIAYVMVALMFVPFGHAMARELARVSPLRGYAANVAGSLLGIVLFTSGSFVLAKPAIWFTLVFASVLPFAWRAPRGAFVAAVGASVACVAFVGWLDVGSVWSPYYRSEVKCAPSGDCALAGNGVWGMRAHRYRPGRSLYNEVYGDGGVFAPRVYDDVLIIGSGAGNDVSVALHHGAAHIDAVEINALGVETGRAIHPDRPYSSPKVSVFIDDGRAFLRNSARSYDLIVYALPDSTGTVTSHANMRMESYLFTVEAFRAVRQHLKPDGVFAVYNHFRELWLVDKIAAMLAEAFGEPPTVFADQLASAVLIAGPGARGKALAPPRVPEATPPPATDDWPFVYLTHPHLPAIYGRALGVVAVTSMALVAGAAWIATRRRRAACDADGESEVSSPFSLDAPMFLMGAAFMLLEAKSIVTFGLLFGSTWLTTALVIGGMLIMVLVAVVVAHTAASRADQRVPWLWAAALVSALLVVYVMPPERMLFANPILRYVAGTALALSPVLFANVIFARLLGATKETAKSLSSNLLGAVLGGALEYSSLVIGYRALLVVVVALYAAAFFFAWRRGEGVRPGRALRDDPGRT